MWSGGSQDGGGVGVGGGEWSWVGGGGGAGAEGNMGGRQESIVVQF